MAPEQERAESSSGAGAQMLKKAKKKKQGGNVIKLTNTNYSAKVWILFLYIFAISHNIVIYFKIHVMQC